MHDKYCVFPGNPLGLYQEKVKMSPYGPLWFMDSFKHCLYRLALTEKKKWNEYLCKLGSIQF